MKQPTRRGLADRLDALGGDPEPLPELTDEEAAAIAEMFTVDAEGRLLFDRPDGGHDEVPI
jgi:hypothetical protein